MRSIFKQIPRSFVPLCAALVCFNINLTTCLSAEHHRMLSDEDKPQKELFTQTQDWAVVKAKVKNPPVSTTSILALIV